MAKMTEIKENVKIPSGVEISIDNKTVLVKGSKGTLTRTFDHPRITITKKENIVEVLCTESPHRREKALVGTAAAHINNMMKGVSEGFEYKMKTVFAHFPIKTSVEGNTFVIQNFLGERSPRKTTILDGVKVVIQAEMVTVSGIDKENVGQTAANIERATKVKKRDVRVFQDGIYIISRRG